MRLIRGPLVVCMLWLLVAPVASAQETKPTIFVGALVRDGFVDMDAGIRDSIRDIQQEFQQTAFTVGRSRDEPTTLVLLVLARGIVTNGSVGFGSSSAVGGTGSGFGFVVPNNVPTLTTILRVGPYERRMQSEGPTWGRAARVVVQDVLAWWEANHDAVRALR
jgi:hypothetical protein